MFINRFALSAALVVVSLSASACGSDTATATAELPTIESSTSLPDPDQTDPAEEGGSESDEADGEEVDPEIAMAEYEACMAEQGVEMSAAIVGDGGSGSGFETLDPPAPDDELGDAAPFDIDDFEAAEEICGGILEDAFGDFELSPEQEAEMADQMLELERCLADAGFEIDTSGGSFTIDDTMDFDAFDEAMRSCNGVFESAVQE